MRRVQLVVTPEAEADLRSYWLWYENEAGLGNDFLSCIESVFNHIQEFPRSAPIIARQIRRAIARRYPCNIYYTFNHNRVQVLAVWAGRASSEERLATLEKQH